MESLPVLYEQTNQLLDLEESLLGDLLILAKGITTNDILFLLRVEDWRRDISGMSQQRIILRFESGVLLGGFNSLFVLLLKLLNLVLHL